MKNQQELLESIVRGIMKRFIANNRIDIPKTLNVKMGSSIDNFSITATYDYKVEEYYVTLTGEGIEFRTAYYYPIDGDKTSEYELYNMPDGIIFDYREVVK